MTEVPRRAGNLTRQDIGVSEKLNRKFLFSVFVGSGNVFFYIFGGKYGGGSFAGKYE